MVLCSPAISICRSGVYQDGKKSDTQLPFVQSRLSTFVHKPEALRAVTEVIRSEMESSPDRIVLRRLFAWILMENRQVESALEQYRTIDRLANANDHEIYSFAERLILERAYKTAADAFKEIIDRNKNPLLVPAARFRYARALEMFDDQADTVYSFSGSFSVSRREKIRFTSTPSLRL